MTLTWPVLATLAGTLILLSAIPSVSVLAVTARAASYGFRQGAMTALGIALGDVLFIVLAIYGLAWFSGVLGDAMTWLRYAAALYLLWLGSRLWRAGRPSAPGLAPEVSMAGSFSSGLLITLGDQKALFFYFGFFPTLFDLTALTGTDKVLMVLVALVPVASVKLVYALECGAGHVHSGLAVKAIVNQRCSCGTVRRWLISLRTSSSALTP